MTDEEHEKEAMVTFVTGLFDAERQKGRELEREEILVAIKAALEASATFAYRKTATGALLDLARDIKNRSAS